MGNGSPALHRQLAGAVLLVGLALAYATPARAETPSPGAAAAVGSATVGVADAVAPAATPIVDAAPVTTADVAAPVTRKLPAAPAAQVETAGVTGQAATLSAASPRTPTLPRTQVLEAVTPLVTSASERSSVGVDARPVTATVDASKQLAPRPQSHPHPQPLSRGRLLHGATETPSAVAALRSLKRAAAAAPLHATVRTQPVGPRSAGSPVPSRRPGAGAGAGTAFGAPPAAGSAQLVASALGALMLAPRETRRPALVGTQQPPSDRFSLLLERPG
jgi:hypothetical protein